MHLPPFLPSILLGLQLTRVFDPPKEFSDIIRTRDSAVSEFSLISPESFSFLPSLRQNHNAPAKNVGMTTRNRKRLA